MYESQFEQELYELRREKLRQIAALGQKSGLTYAAATYPNSYAATHTIPQLRAAFDPITPEQFTAEIASGTKHEVSIAGRIMAIRVQGKAGFAQLQQGGERMQIYVRKDDVGEDAFALYKLLDLGDHIGVRGTMMRTRTGELTVHVTSLTFLTKAMLALPDKYHGLEDTELRYRQRYVDLFMNTGHSAKAATPPLLSSRSEAEGPAAPPLLSSRSEAEGPASPAAPPPPTETTDSLNVREVFVKRAAILRALRTFFDTRGYLEVETPMMHTISGGAAARPFETHHNALDIPLKLRIAPELYLKRLVVGGMDRVYEINRNFRNEGISTQHNPEFTMLEFYQAYSNYHDLMDLTQELVTYVATEVNGTTKTIFNNTEIDLAKWTRLSMREAIDRFWPTDIGDAPTPTELSDRTLLLAKLNNLEPELAKFEDSYKMSFLTLRGQSDVHEFSKLSPEEKIAESKQRSAQPLEKVQNTQQFTLYTQVRAMRSVAPSAKSAPLGKIIASLFEAVAEPHLIQPTIIYDFPLAVSPLSKIKPDEPDWVERFEFYIGGFEVGNAFSELNDPDDQRARFEAQLEERKRGDDEAMAEVDEDYIRALGYGLPPTAGEGIGIDRLTMILTGQRSIRDVILFPLMRPHAKSTPNEPPPE